MSKVQTIEEANLFSEEVRGHLKAVYSWLLIGILFACGAGYASLNIGGAPVPYTVDHRTVDVPPLVIEIAENAWLLFFAAMGLTVMVKATRRLQPLNIISYLGLTSLLGFFAGPAVFVAQLHASSGNTLSLHPVRDAALLTLAAFTGLTTYVFVTKKDFSFMRASLITGLWVVIAAGLLAILLGSSVLHLAVASVAVILFCGFVLFDTAKILLEPDLGNAVGDALGLFLDVLNIFINLLSIFSSKSSSDD